jgi:hypothetical protein
MSELNCTEPSLKQISFQRGNKIQTFREYQLRISLRTKYRKELLVKGENLGSAAQ